MKNVLLRGPTLTNSGYGVHSRQLFRWLLSKEQEGKIKLLCQPTTWGITSWGISPEKFGGLAGEIMKRSVAFETKPDVTFQVQMPFEFDSSLGNYNIGVTAGIETDRCHDSWHGFINSMDAVIVPSQHAKRSVSGGPGTSKVVVIPESFYDNLSEDYKGENPFEFSTDFNFLLFGQITGDNPENDRKNFYNTIKWFCEEFSGDKNVGLVVKTNRGRGTTLDRHNTAKLLEKLLEEIRPSGYPKVHLVHGDLEEDDVHALYSCESVKCLVSFTRGEGFGLPLLESAATGLPIIATGWSAHTEFLTNFIKVRYELKNIPKSRSDSQIFLKGSRWAEVYEEDAKKKMRKFYQDASSANKSAEILQRSIRKKYSWEEIAKKYERKFGEMF